MNINIGDERLNKRSRLVIENLARDPQGSVNASMHGWTDTQGAYRFFDNDLVEPEKILKPHREETIRRIKQHNVVLLPQDTTELDYTSHPVEGGGPRNHEDQNGFIDHTQLALTPGQLCLGVIDVEIYARSLEGFGESKQRQNDPLETKEIFRWLRDYRVACEVQQQTPDTQVVSLADCEGDLYEVYVEAQQHENPADYVIRSGKTRSLTELNPDAPGQTYHKLQEQIDDAKLLIVKECELPRTPKREGRTAKLEIRATTMRIKPPHTKGDQPEVELNVVLVREIDPPDDGTAVEWLLITSLPIDTVEQVQRVIDYYTARWAIENYQAGYTASAPLYLLGA